VLWRLFLFSLKSLKTITKVFLVGVFDPTILLFTEKITFKRAKLLPFSLPTAYVSVLTSSTSAITSASRDRDFSHFSFLPWSYLFLLSLPSMSKIRSWESPIFFCDTHAPLVVIKLSLFMSRTSKFVPNRWLNNVPTQVYLSGKALTFAGALGTDHRNGAVLLTESKQVIWGQEIVKRLSTKARWWGHIWQGRAYLYSRL
jgi:hypothetical protein